MTWFVQFFFSHVSIMNGDITLAMTTKIITFTSRYVQSVYSRKGGVDPYFHTFVLWALDWGWIEQTLKSRRSPPETEVSLSLDMSIKPCDGFFSKHSPKSMNISPHSMHFVLHLTLHSTHCLQTTNSFPNLRAALDYDGEVHRSWMIGDSKIWLAEGDTLVWWWFTLQPRVIWWRTLYIYEKLTWLPTWRDFLEGGVLRRSSFLGNLKASDNKLDLQRTPTWENSLLSSHLLRHTIRCLK